MVRFKLFDSDAIILVLFHGDLNCYNGHCEKILIGVWDVTICSVPMLVKTNVVMVMTFSCHLHLAYDRYIMCPLNIQLDILWAYKAEDCLGLG